MTVFRIGEREVAVSLDEMHVRWATRWVWLQWLTPGEETAAEEWLVVEAVS